MIIHVQILICGVSVWERQLQMLVVSAPKISGLQGKRVCVTEIRNHHQLIIIVNFDTPFPLLEENNSINVPNGENKFISNMHVGYIILYDYKVT